MSVSDEHWYFLHAQVLTDCRIAALARGNVYDNSVEDDDPRRGDLNNRLCELLTNFSGGYLRRVREEDHVHRVNDVADTLTTEFADILRDGRFRIGIAQKALNLYLKFLWCLGKIPTPPHCPFDSQIIGLLGLKDPPNWTKLDDMGEYKLLVEAAQQKAKGEDISSIAEWELRRWRPGGAAGVAW